MPAPPRLSIALWEPWVACGRVGCSGRLSKRHSMPERRRRGRQESAGQKALTQAQPDTLDRVQLQTVGPERYQRDAVWHASAGHPCEPA